MFNQAYAYRYPQHCYRQYRGQINQHVEDRSLLLPFLVGAAVAFPIGYIASNTNKQQAYYQMPYQQPYPMYYQYPQQYYGYQPMPIYR